MKKIFSVLCLFVLFISTSIEVRGDNKFIELTGWGWGNPEEIVPKAAEIGFNEIVVWDHNSDYLRKLVKIAEKYEIRIYSSIYLNDIAGWEEIYPDTSPPLQVMNEAENAVSLRINNDESKGKSKYQYGGEPFQKIEVSDEEILCFHNPKVVELFKKQIREIIAVPGIKGIAFDWFGYRNYHCCYCEDSMRQFKEFRKKFPNLKEEECWEKFSFESLVDFNNQLAAYIRSLSPDIKIITHVYPVYLPDPLYGNQLNVDVCGQTAAWFFEPFWTYEKISNYSRIIFGEEKKYYSRSEGSALIGIWNKPKLYPIKTPERIEKELQAILDAGGDRVQVCAMNDVIDTKEIGEVFKKFFK